MTTNASLLLVFTTVLMAFAPAARADDWSKAEAFRKSDATTIKVFKPEGYTVSVTVAGQTLTDTVPAAIPVSTGDGFVRVTLTSPSGAKWATKVETRSGQTTELRVTHLASPASEPAPDNRKFIGKLKWDAKSCGGVEGIKPRIDFLDKQGATTASLILKTTATKSLELPPGTYSVRTFNVNPDGTNPQFKNSTSVAIEGDGWSGSVACKGKGYEVDFAKR